jgi:DNA-binding FrmR family transcriptional regulator
VYRAVGRDADQIAAGPDTHGEYDRNVTTRESRTASTTAGTASTPSDAALAPVDADTRRAAFRHSYSKDKAQLVRRLSRIEGQVRGIGRMIEREEYCVDILQQTAALRAAVDALSVLVLEDHIAGCVRTAAERGEAEAYVDEVMDVVRRSLGRPIRTPRTV